MKKITVLLVMLLIANALSVSSYYDGVTETVGNPDTSDWYEWKIPDDKAALGTAIDASKFIEAPTGKHGFLNQTKGRDFYFEDGTKAKFMGTNLAMQASFKTHEEAERMAERIARSGFNLVRFHNLDIDDDSNIWGSAYENTDPIAPGLAEQLQWFDPGQTDKLFYLFAELKKRGVYFYIDWYTNDMIFATDTDPDEHMIKYRGEGQIYTPYVFTNKDLTEHFKTFARELFTTVNPYTGLSLADDPAMAMIDFINEKGGLLYAPGRFSDIYYRAEVTAAFNRWLEEKYQTRQSLERAWGEAGKKGLEAFENFTDGTVIYIPDPSKEFPAQMKGLNYSEARISDAKEFLYDTEYKWMSDMKDFLRNELGIKCCLTSTGGGGDDNFMPMIDYLNVSLFDFADNHGYKSHPLNYTFKNGELSSWTSGAIVGGKELDRLIKWFPPDNQPFVVGEWNVCSPGAHSAEGDLMVAVNFSRQGWVPVQFSLLGSNVKLPNESLPVLDFFATFYDGAKTSMHPLAAMIYYHDDIKAPEDEYYFSFNFEDTKQDEIHEGDECFIGPDLVNIYLRAGLHMEGASADEYVPNPEHMERAYKKLETNEPQDGQFDWNVRTGIYRLSTEHTNLATGYIGNKNVALSFMNVKIDNYFGSVVLTSTSDQPLESADQMLLGTIIHSRNKGMILDDEKGAIVTTVGTGPQIMQPLYADITLKTTDEIKVYALDSSGVRTAEVPVIRDSSGYARLRADGGKYKAVHYEIIREKG